MLPWEGLLGLHIFSRIKPGTDVFLGMGFVAGDPRWGGHYN